MYEYTRTAEFGRIFDIFVGAYVAIDVSYRSVVCSVGRRPVWLVVVAYVRSEGLTIHVQLVVVAWCRRGGDGWRSF